MNNFTSTLDNLYKYYQTINQTINQTKTTNSNNPNNQNNPNNPNNQNNPNNSNNQNNILGYATGDQGWYDKIGGGPCDTYCRYVGLSPNIKWSCSNKHDLNNIEYIHKDKSGLFCYPYNKTKSSPKNLGKVIDGKFYPHNTMNSNNNYILWNNFTTDTNNLNNTNYSSKHPIPNTSEIECANICDLDTECKSYIFTAGTLLNDTILL